MSQDGYERKGAGKAYLGQSPRTLAPASQRVPSSQPGSLPLAIKEHSGGYPEAAGVGLDMDEVPPRRSLGAYNRSPGNRTPSLLNESSATSVASDVQSSDFDLDSKFREEGSEGAILAPMPLLKADPPTLVGGAAECYSVYIRRASLCQRYGVSFDAAETVDRRLWAITIAEDLPYLGIGRGDQVVSVNQRVPRSVDECRSILERAMSIDLVLQRRQPDKWASRPSGKAAGGVLLSVTQATITDARIGEFRLTMHRNSQRQRFGLVFEPIPPKRRGEELAIIVADDMPHLALQRGDRLVSLNGVRIRNKRICSQILGTAMSLHLIMRREHGSLSSLEHQVEPLDDYEEVEYAPAPSLINCMNCVHKEEPRAITVVPITSAVPVAPPAGALPVRGVVQRLPEQEIVGYDAMGGAIDMGDAGCGLFPMCTVPRQVEYEQIGDGSTDPPLVQLHHFAHGAI